MTAADLDLLAAEYERADRRKKVLTAVIATLFVATLAGAFGLAENQNAGAFRDGFSRILDFPAGVIEEAWRERAALPGLMLKYLPALIETVNIAAVATLIGGVGGAVLSLLSTRGLARWPGMAGLFRRMLDVMRAFPDIVIALVLIFILGGGPVPAAIAIALHTVGALGKLFAEVNENVDMKPVEGVRATGGTWAQQMWFGVVSQVAPNYLSYFLLRFEINIRASAILGFVGAGGIGYDLRNTISWGQGQFDDSTAIFILLFLTIVIVDQISSRARAWLTGHAAPTRGVFS
jgi:phosphonate transport system permease protein